MSIASTTLGDAPDQVLQQALYGSVPEIKPYDALGELNKRVKAKQVSSAMQGNDAIRQAQQMAQQPPVAQQLLMQLNQGVGGLPVQETQSFASGGIVAFNDGGMPLGDQEQSDRAAILSGLEAIGMTPAKLWAAGYDVGTMPLRALASVYNQMARIPRAFGAGQTLIPDEFTLSKPTSVYDHFFPPEAPVDPNARVGTEKGRGTNTGNATFTPSVPPAPQAAVAVPPTGITGPKLGGGGAGGGAGAGSRAGIASLTAPTYKPINPQYEIPEERSAAGMRAEDEASVNPAMSEYDTRMGKFKQRALDMQEGKNIKKPTRLQRGMGAFMSGASEEYAAARRAGVRPSLGAALGAAGNAARKGDADLQAKIEAMREKGFEAEQAMEQSRMAYKAGQQELGAKYGTLSRNLKMEALKMRNTVKDKDLERADKENERQMKLYELALRKQMADDQNKTTLAAAAVRTANTGSLTPQRMAELRRKVEVDVDKGLEKDPQYMLMQVKAPAQAQARRQQLLDARLQRVLIEETGGTLPTAPGATPGVAPTRVVDFNTIK